MRTLILVPVIHTSADLGSLAKEVTGRGIAVLGEEAWEKHTAVVEKFWNKISDYFNSIDVSGMKIYQDGMIAEGEIGQKIVEESAKAGSRNYELVSRLLKRGAILVKTEDFKLVKEERDLLVALTQAKSMTHKLIAFIKYKLVKDKLLNKRDEFIAKRIDESLAQEATGVLFIGAYHNIEKWLPGSIRVREIKEARKVKEYQRLLPFCHKHKKQFDELTNHLISEVHMSNRDFGTCCVSCQSYWTCETKWYRGEKGEKDVCCNLCNFYDDCFMEQVKKRTLAKKDPAADKGK